MALSKQLLAGAALAGALVAGSANAAYIQDNYLGMDTNIGAGNTGTDFSNTDAIGGAYFQVYGARAGFTGTTLNVVIDTNFFEQPGNSRYFGDLFISLDGYTPPANSSTDFGVVAAPLAAVGTHGVAPGEAWELAFDTDAGQLLAIDGSTTIRQGSVRQGQEYRVQSGGTAVAGNSTFQELGDINGYQGTNALKYSIDLSFLSGTGFFANGPEVGVHWTMYCGNDVFEAHVPEPSSIALLSLGLIGLGAIRRKNRQA